MRLSLVAAAHLLAAGLRGLPIPLPFGVHPPKQLNGDDASENFAGGSDDDIPGREGRAEGPARRFVRRFFENGRSEGINGIAKHFNPSDDLLDTEPVTALSAHLRPRNSNSPMVVHNGPDPAMCAIIIGAVAGGMLFPLGKARNFQYMIRGAGGAKRFVRSLATGAFWPKEPGKRRKVYSGKGGKHRWDNPNSHRKKYVGNFGPGQPLKETAYWWAPTFGALLGSMRFRMYCWPLFQPHIPKPILNRLPERFQKRR